MVGYVFVYLGAVMLGYNFVGGVNLSGFFVEGEVGMERGD